MQIRLGTLRRYLREVALAEAPAYPGQPYGRNVLSPDINDREQIGKLDATALDTVDDPDGMPDHLTEPKVSKEDCYGPVPPDAEPPYVGQDPFARDVGVLPTPGTRRG